MNRKPRILIVSDSGALDTGFGRVARNIGLHFVETGDYVVAQHGWFHSHGDRVVPFTIYPTNGKNEDRYGQQSYDSVVARFNPDVVIAMGDHWMIGHLGNRPRKHKLIGYFPVDGIPIRPEVAKIFASFDQAVFYGQFGADGAKHAMPNLPFEIIPHGVDVETFKPVSPQERSRIRKEMMGSDDMFLVGCVARNNTRKNLPLLIKTFSAFIKPWWCCQKCGHMERGNSPQCTVCTSSDVANRPAKDNAYLYLHCKAEDGAGHDMHDLIRRYGLAGRVMMPQALTVAHGCSDRVLSQIYNAFDLFALPTGGEGWGLPILEAMACGVPALVTEYSGHLDFCMGASEMIGVSEFVTQPEGNVEHAVPSPSDFEMKMDRFYYGYDSWFAKWGVSTLRIAGAQGADVEGIMQQLPTFWYGKQMCTQLGEIGHKRAQQFSWQTVLPQWSALVNRLLNHDPSQLTSPVTPNKNVEVL